jgi:hypothetical protein
LATPVNNAANQPVPLSLFWNKASMAESYSIQVAKDTNFTNLVFSVPTVIDTSNLITGLSNDTKYYWRVNAKNYVGTGVWSDAWSFTTIVPIPNPPVLVAPVNNAMNQNVALNLSWKLPKYAQAFKLNLAEDDQFLSSIIKDSLVSDTLKSIGGLKEGKKYYWKVSAINQSGESLFSDTWNFTTILDAPDSIAATVISRGKIKLIWKDKSGANDAFKIERKLNGSYTVLDSVAAGVTGYTDTTAVTPGIYYYRLNAFTAYASSGYSKEVSVITAPSAPILASPLSAAKDVTVNLKLVWMKSQIAKTYRVCLSENDQFINVTINDSTLTDTVKNITGLKEGTKYYWKVSASNLAGESIFSEVRNFSTLLSAPDSLVATALEKGKIKLTWKYASGSVAGFKIERKHNDNYILIDSVKAGVTAYIDTSLTALGYSQYKVSAYTAYTQSSYSNEASVLITGVNNYGSMPTEYSILQNYPNPFNPTTDIIYALPSESLVKITVYDILGKAVKELANSVQSAGYHKINFNAINLSSGIYFYAIETNSTDGVKQFRQVKKMLLLK